MMTSRTMLNSPLGHHCSPEPSTSFEIADRVLVDLQNPRPKLLRDTNNYTEVLNSNDEKERFSATVHHVQAEKPSNLAAIRASRPKNDGKKPALACPTVAPSRPVYKRSDDFVEINSINVATLISNKSRSKSVGASQNGRRLKNGACDIMGRRSAVERVQRKTDLLNTSTVSNKPSGSKESEVKKICQIFTLLCI